MSGVGQVMVKSIEKQLKVSYEELQLSLSAEFGRQYMEGCAPDTPEELLSRPWILTLWSTDH